MQKNGNKEVKNFVTKIYISAQGRGSVKRSGKNNCAQNKVYDLIFHEHLCNCNTNVSC